MHFLGLDYIISSLIWLFVIFAIVFAFRKHIKNLLYPQASLDLFVGKIKHYLSDNYPKIKFDLSIIEESSEEKNPELRKHLIIGNIIEQYKKLTIKSENYPKATPSTLRWDSYIFNSEPHKNKLPPDWEKRKNALIIRDHKSCLRCSKKVTQTTICIYLLRPVSQGGTYHLENLLSVCRDCDKILDQERKKVGTLQIQDDLEDIVQKT